jgi:hypothetical protein
VFLLGVVDSAFGDLDVVESSTLAFLVAGVLESILQNRFGQIYKQFGQL